MLATSGTAQPARSVAPAIRPTNVAEARRTRGRRPGVVEGACSVGGAGVVLLMVICPSDVRVAGTTHGWAVRSRHSLPEPSRRPCFLRVLLFAPVRTARIVATTRNRRFLVAGLSGRHEKSNGTTKPKHPPRGVISRSVYG